MFIRHLKCNHLQYTKPPRTLHTVTRNTLCPRCVNRISSTTTQVTRVVSMVAVSKKKLLVG